MTTYLRGPADPADPGHSGQSGDSGDPGQSGDSGDDSTWWDRHGDGSPPGVAAATVPADEPEPGAAGSGGPPWSILLTTVAVVGSVLTLPVLGFAGGFGRIVAPTVWVFVGLAVGLRLSDRAPTWDLRDRRRVERLVGCLVAYAGTAVPGLRWFEGEAAWWVPGTVLTALTPFAMAQARRGAGRLRRLGG